jgi:tRNA pseudouridine55 synthase
MPSVARSDVHDLHGVLVVDKPRGPTSHDVVQRVRRTLGVRAVGHAGTLDPMASGVLVVAVGEATKLSPWLTAHDKTYEASVALGVETDTLDAEGRVTHRSDPSDALTGALTRSAPGAVDEAIEAALGVERARTLQRPPAHSAIHVDGRRAFQRARRGEPVELAERDVRVLAMEVLACAAEPARIDVSLTVSKGYYVRALARDLAAALGTVGHLTALKRTQSGCFAIAQAISPDLGPDALRAAIIPIALAAARALPVVHLTESGVREARHGRAVPPEEMPGALPGASAWLSPGGDLVAIGDVDEAGRGRVIRGMRLGSLLLAALVFGHLVLGGLQPV